MTGEEGPVVEVCFVAILLHDGGFRCSESFQICKISREIQTGSFNLRWKFPLSSMPKSGAICSAADRSVMVSTDMRNLELTPSDSIV